MNPISALKALIAALAVLGVFYSGYRYAAALGDKKLADLQREYAQQAQVAEQKAREKEQESARKLVEALNEKEKMETVLAGERADFAAQLERMRESAARNQRRSTMPGTHAAAVKPYQERLASCQRLLIEGAELLQQGADLVGRTAADKDALTRVMTPNP